jgi:hypothetical protein
MSNLFDEDLTARASSDNWSCELWLLPFVQNLVKSLEGGFLDQVVDLMG